jgi:hypothetical protein
VQTIQTDKGTEIFLQRARVSSMSIVLVTASSPTMKKLWHRQRLRANVRPMRRILWPRWRTRQIVTMNEKPMLVPWLTILVAQAS